MVPIGVCSSLTRGELWDEDSSTVYFLLTFIVRPPARSILFFSLTI